MPVVLLALATSGCFLVHSPEDAPREEDPPGGDPDPASEWLVFRRGEPEPPITRPRELRAVSLDGHGAELFVLPEYGYFDTVEGRGETVVATVGEGSGEVASHLVTVPGGESLDTGYGGTTHLSEDGETVLHFTSEGIVQTAADGTELLRLGVPGRGGVASPRQTTVVRPDLEGDAPSLTFALLPAGGTWTGPVDAAVLGPVTFAADERVAYVATAGEPAVWTAPSYVLSRVDLRTAHTELVPLEIPADHALTGVDRCTDTLYFVDGSGAVSAREGGGEPYPVTDAAATPPAVLNRPFAEVGRLSPDGRHLLWLGIDGLLWVADVEAGTVRAADMPPLPVPSSCCGDNSTDVVVGNFVDGSVSVGVAPPTLRRICSCAPIDPATEPLAFRVDVETGTAEGVDHCGRSTPWLTRDGRMVVCDENDTGVVRIGLATDAGFEALTDGPYDVGAFPLAPETGCGLPAR